MLIFRQKRLYNNIKTKRRITLYYPTKMKGFLLMYNYRHLLINDIDKMKLCRNLVYLNLTDKSMFIQLNYSQ